VEKGYFLAGEGRNKKRKSKSMQEGEKEGQNVPIDCEGEG